MAHGESTHVEGDVGDACAWCWTGRCGKMRHEESGRGVRGGRKRRMRHATRAGVRWTACNPGGCSLGAHGA
jgi:hypothetical protein